ncbi:hypothetical protein SLEP1_g7518 [Rubroshorea leprosula]|uniref:Uncharacterized protein n=1 Tax=Rubroshorea leprosula TaxID=152421 RepID=A0AAV5I9L4_9ROSI|nr:hypothetical protein SLEP1_g7518 [Rubroshorea leprosula]
MHKIENHTMLWNPLRCASNTVPELITVLTLLRRGPLNTPSFKLRSTYSIATNTYTCQTNS